MNHPYRIYIVLSFIFITGLIYRAATLLHPSFTFVTISRMANTPEYLKSTHACTINTYLPKATAKALHRLEISQILERESIYKIVTPDKFNPSRIDNCLILSSLDKESNFIHASFGTQVPHILKKFFPHETDVLLLELDKKALADAKLTLKKEQNKADGPFFPHLYGTQKISLTVVKTIIELKKEQTEWFIDTLSIIVPRPA